MPEKELQDSRADRGRFVRRVLTVVFIVLGVLSLLTLSVLLIDALMVIFAGILLAIFLRTLADFVCARTGLHPGRSLVIVVLGLLLIGGLTIYFVAPAVAEQSAILARELPEAVEEMKSRVSRTEWGRQAVEYVEEENGLLPVGTKDLVARARPFFSTFLGAFFGLIVALVIGLYGAANPALYRRGFVKLVPPERRARAGEILECLVTTLRQWLFSRLLVMFVVGLLVWVGLTALGMPLALPLALIAAIFEFIPNIGPILAALPAILLALVISPNIALYVVLLYIVIQALESWVISPLVIQKMVEVPPVLTISMIVILASLLGPLGALLAEPITAAGMVLVRMLYVEDALNDRSGETASDPVS